MSESRRHSSRKSSDREVQPITSAAPGVPDSRSAAAASPKDNSSADSEGASRRSAAAIITCCAVPEAIASNPASNAENPPRNEPPKSAVAVSGPQSHAAAICDAEERCQYGALVEAK